MVRWCSNHWQIAETSVIERGAAHVLSYVCPAKRTNAGFARHHSRHHTVFGISQLSAQSPSSTPAFHEQVIGEIPTGTALKAWVVAGDHVAWAGAKDGKWTVMLDGKQQGGTYNNVEFLTLSPDGLHCISLASCATSGSTCLTATKLLRGTRASPLFPCNPGATPSPTAHARKKTAAGWLSTTKQPPTNTKT